MLLQNQILNFLFYFYFFYLSPCLIIKFIYTVNSFSFREPEFYYQEQDQRSDENNYLNIYFRAFDFFNKSLSIVIIENSLKKFFQRVFNFYMHFIIDNDLLKKSKALKYIYSENDFRRFFGPAPDKIYL